MSETETGGPAFPPMHNPSTHHSGMTLRDWFAGQALTNPYTAHDGDADKVAEWAYQVADAMIFAKSNRIGTQAVRDLEAKLAKAVEALDKINVGEGWAAQIARTAIAELTGGKDE